MKLESAQINNLAAAGTRIPNQGQGGRWQGVERPKKKNLLKFQNTAEKMTADPSGGRSKMMVCKSKHSVPGSLFLHCTAGQEPTHSSRLESPCLKRANRPLE